MPNSENKKWNPHELLLLPLIVLLLLLSLLHLLHKDQAYSETEKRALASRPSPSASTLWEGGFFSSVDNWFADQFPLRNGWIGMNYFGNTLRGSREADDVYVGKHGTLFTKPTVLNEEALARTQEALTTFAAANPDMPMHFFLVPDAATVHPQDLPLGAPVPDQMAEIDTFRAALPENFSSPDLTAILQLDRSGERLFYRTDHHWTSEGAFAVFQQTAASLGIESLPAYTRYTLTNDFRGTLSARSGNHRLTDTITIYAPKDETSLLVRIPDTNEKSTSLYQAEALDGGDPYTVFLGGNHPVVEISSMNMNGRHLLLFKDSYANSFVPFLAPYYETITMVDPRYYYDDLSLLIKQHEINEVLFLYSADTLFEDTSLATVLAP